MSSTETYRQAVLKIISNGNHQKIGQVTYVIDDKKVHIKVKSGNLGKYPFNINPTVLNADYEVYVCGTEDIFYIIPKRIIRKMWDDPNAMIDYANGYTILDVYPNQDKIVYGTGGKSIDISLFKSSTIKKIENIESNDNSVSHAEGENHKRLKEWISNNPSFLGIENVILTEVDNHTFPSGDRPDIIFTYNPNSYATIEIETDNPLPGAYQAIKYRFLLCAELGLELFAENVKTYLVAWEIPKDVKDFCSKYNVSCYEKIL